MKSPCALLALLSLVLLSTSIESRKDPAEYWTSVMNEQPMPEAIQRGLVLSADSAEVVVVEVPKQQHFNDQKGADCHDQNVKPYADDFEPRPNVSQYGENDTKKKVKSFADDFEPRPNVSQYGDNDTKNKDKSFVKNHENDGGNVAEPFAQDFEPRPNVSIYNE